jgi:hypothetical protein
MVGASRLAYVRKHLDLPKCIERFAADVDDHDDDGCEHRLHFMRRRSHPWRGNSYQASTDSFHRSFRQYIHGGSHAVDRQWYRHRASLVIRWTASAESPAGYSERSRVARCAALCLQWGLAKPLEIKLRPKYAPQCRVESLNHRHHPHTGLINTRQTLAILGFHVHTIEHQRVKMGRYRTKGS